MIKTLALISVLAISQEVSASCRVGSETLKSTNNISCTGDLSHAEAVIKFNPAKDADLYISGEAVQGCGDFPSYRWEELDQNGSVISSVDAQQSMTAVASHRYQLKVIIKEPSCQSYGLQLYIGSY